MGLDSFFKIGTRDPSQPTIKASLQSKEKWYDTDMAIALWFYDSSIPLNACNSPFFQIAMSKVASMGHGYTEPSYHALRVSLLRDAKKQVALIVDSFRIGTPLVRLLRICDSDEKPSLGYVYEGMFRARKAIKDLFRNKKRLYQQYVDIINARWDKMLRKSLHVAAYYLNPAFQYDKEFFCEKTEVLRGLLDYIDTRVETGGQKAYNEISIYRDRQKSFARPTALTIARSTRPASSSGCERNWSVFEHIHTKKRNRLEHQRLNDLVYVHYNLRLQNRVKYSKRPYDPVDYECIDKSEFWIVEETPEGELDYDAIEELLEEEMPRYDEGLSFDPETETNDVEPIAEADLEQFGRQYRSTYCSDNKNKDDWD
ncbi:UNVERIFIED_CONTAM: hypothetical protein Slati_3673200 [Sesamum latifolium]|uniref:HAT C-terminal dimerisation domain-containing protein n=1 Tax=Sesamum latifolium TaxID=2727402 RepID=A0AAW2U2W0_9LAMI